MFDEIQKVKDRVKMRVKKLLIEKYNIDEIMASRMVNDSILSHMLDIDTTYVTHYEDNEWAKDILKQYKVAM